MEILNKTLNLMGEYKTIKGVLVGVSSVGDNLSIITILYTDKKTVKVFCGDQEFRADLIKYMSLKTDSILEFTCLHSPIFKHPIYQSMKVISCTETQEIPFL
jgi:hypothetical protein